MNAKNKPRTQLRILDQKQNFLGLPMEHAGIDTARFIVVPVAYERTTSYRKGTKYGPAKLLEASRQLEFYDEELTEQIGHLTGIATLAPFKPNAKESAPQFFGRVANAVEPLLARGKFLITVGGEHTVAYAPILAHSKHYPDLSILHFDAHADLRNSYEKTPWNHACALRRAIECFSVPPKVSMVGIRSLDWEEVRYLKENPNIQYFGMEKYRQNLKGLIEAALAHLGEQVYITIDLDGLDPAVVPGVGTPQPGGFGWYEALDLFRAFFENKKVVGFDFMELAPMKNEVCSEFAAAKLLYRLIGYAFLAAKKNAQDADKQSRLVAA